MTKQPQKTVKQILSERITPPDSSLDKRLLRFVKEWGGVATVLIAILYTFPFDAASRFISWREHDTSQARQVLAEVASLYADQTAAIEKMENVQLRNFLQNTYSIRIYNKHHKAS